MARGQGEKGDRRGKPGLMRFPIWYLFVVILLVLGIQTIVRPPHVEEISYSEFKALVAKGAVDDLEIGENTVKGTFLREQGPEAGRARFLTVRVEDADLVKELAEHEITYKGTVEATWVKNLLALVFPIFLFFMIWMLLSRRMGGGTGGGFMSIGSSKAKIYAQDEIKVNFGDVAGVEEAEVELMEVVEFLKSPAKFQSLGGKIPKGVLLVGPPGCGKTLLAKAVAGEAGVPFFSISGSEFVEMFVGVGAARVRDLFAQAQKRAPCIIFIDELDALGKVRGMSSIGGHDEREQTLNQLLVEMDGFSSSKGVIIMAATNRPEILDPALLRPGRFDRHILVDRPDIRGREAILEVHVRSVKLGDDVDLTVLAGRTPGFGGADLANMVNEAALLAARRNKPAVTMEEFEEAIDREVAGLEKKSRVMNKREKTITAIHESGHALVAELLPGTNPVHKVSIIPRGIAGLGFTIQRPTEDRYLMTKGELVSQLGVLLGGRVAEELTLDEVSTGAHNDLQKATDIARSMVKTYGMSEKLGLVAFDDERQPLFFAAEGARPKEYSEETAREIDLEVRKIIEEAYATVRELLEKDKDILEKVSETLLEKEVIEGKEIRAIIAKHRKPVEEKAPAPVPSPSLAERVNPPDQQ